ncbi:apolipoprotein L5-like [Coregonus clupeaformis]|uniref:apolipoprotein L5-like n=1 Tax=Coregonus clupeaformis TaxID=59861 RepID=UPI001BE0E7DB|nr:apolipoprotein L5-like [Coregonus clupeaformis]
MKTVGCWENMPPSFYGLSLEDETREFSQRCLHVKNGLHLFNCLIMKRNDTLRGQITELNDLAEKLDKVQKTKTMSIAGGTTGAVGGAVAVVGIVLAPMTMGASLIATAVGAGMVASGSGMGIKAAMDNNKSNSVDRKRLEEVVQKYKAEIADVVWSLCFIHSGMAELRQYNLHRLQHADPEALRIARVAGAVHPGCNKSQQLGMKSEMILQGFARDMDLYYTDKDGQRLKKGSETKFATRICGVTQELQEELNELHQVWQTFSLAASRF